MRSGNTSEWLLQYTTEAQAMRGVYCLSLLIVVECAVLVLSGLLEWPLDALRRLLVRRTTESRPW
jgi:hypothetical protein